MSWRACGLWKLPYVDDLIMTAEVLVSVELMFWEWRQAWRGEKRIEGKLKEGDGDWWANGCYTDREASM